MQDNTGLVPWLTRKDIATLGVNLKKNPKLNLLSEKTLLVPGDIIPGSFTAFNFPAMRLDISIPQAELTERVRGDISPEQWNNGINAYLLNYSFSGSEQRSRYGNSSNHTLRLDNGMNIGAWRLRDSRSWQLENNKHSRHSQLDHSETYAERIIIPLRSNIRFGDSRTKSDVFDSLGFRGVSLTTDENMVPDTLRGFAPIIRGVAASSALVTVRQNGYEIYQMPVPPGPFVIRDLRAMGTAGDLEVTVKEADGSIKRFTVPYSTVPVLMREGNKEYALTMGKLRSKSERYDKPAFVQGTLSWGLPGDVTLYGGTQLANRYRAISAGAGVNMAHFGALSGDITHADSKLADGNSYHGFSTRFLYSWYLGLTDTTFNLVGYRYSSHGFHTLDETALKSMSGWLYDYNQTDGNGRFVNRTFRDYYNLNNHRKQRIAATISQRAGSLGTFYVSGSRESYWEGRSATNFWQAGFSGQIGNISYTLSGSYQEASTQLSSDRAVSLYISVPLNDMFSRASLSNASFINASFAASQTSQSGATQRAGLRGSMWENRLNWSVDQGYSRYGKESGNATLGYRSNYGDGNIGYGYSRNYQSVNYGFSGAALLHRNGLTLGPETGDGAVLIAAPKASGTAINNFSNIHIDRRGYALLPALSPYQENAVSLDVNSLPDDVDTNGASQKVIPTQGAIVRANFKTQQGKRLLISLEHNGKPLQFGTMVTSNNTFGGIVGDHGQVYLVGQAYQGKLTAKWGDSPEEQCVVNYRVPAGDDAPVIRIKENCR